MKSTRGSGMARASLDMSRKVAGLLKQRRRDLGISLQEVEGRAARLGVRLPASTLLQIERGAVNPGARRWIALVHIYNVELLADSMELGAMAGVRTPVGSLEELAQRGTRAWMAGDLGDALAHALAIREHPADNDRARVLKQGALICFATYARNLGKYRLARQMVEELLVQPLGRRELTDTLVLAASIWLGLGSPEAALAMVERAGKRMDPADRQRVAYVEHQWAKLLLRSGEAEDAERHLDRALALYREVDDAYNEVRALGLRTQILEARGTSGAALTCARQAVDRARTLDYGMLLCAAQLDLGRVLMACARSGEAVEPLRQSLTSARLLEERRIQLYAHARLWKAYLALGETEAAALELRHAAELVERADEVSEELEEVRRAAAAMAPRPRKVRTRSARKPVTETVN
ncbi:MAG TPA: helix-turn-helix transcriptional regulator [Candidatus Polarisedimenticolaceae bacterium]|nr:helix-turn-helix transcriptional regulator [Candidatus Polarisedimenticolaceae bacterium]